jgi:auxin responsive GH3 family protein
MEFDPVEGGATVGVEALEEGREYELFVTTCGGLYRYAMRDVVRAGAKWEGVPTIAFARKTGAFLSVTGEKVSDVQVLAAAGEAARATGFALAGAGAALEMAEPPAYVLLAEPAAAASSPDGAARATADLAAAFDRALSAANVEYAGKRADGRLAPAKARLVAAGSFEAKRRARVEAGGPDAQVKTPVLFPEGFGS